MEGFFEQGVDQFTYYQKDVDGKKSRNQKKNEKIVRMKHDMNDPQMKKQRHQIRRTLQKNKLQRQLAGLTEQQTRQFLDARKLKKQQAKQRTIKALKDIQNGQQIYVDIAYEKRMNEKENKSLSLQIELITKALKHLNDPPAIHLCSVGGVVEQQLQKMGYHYWILGSHKEDVVEVAQQMKRKLIYLSPDAPEPLEQVRSDTAYIIGGLVDRTVLKNGSYDRARQLGIEARCLPIKQMMKNRNCLNLDHVVMILSKYKQCNNWQEAFDYGAPKRWKRQEKKQSSQEEITKEQQEKYEPKEQVQKQIPQII